MSKQFVFDQSGGIKPIEEIKKEKAPLKFKIGDVVRCKTYPNWIGTITDAPFSDFETLYLVQIFSDKKITVVSCAAEEELEIVKE